MIVENGTYYLYRHIRLDTNQIFYIGIGKKSSYDLQKGTYGRATLKVKRNGFWNIIVAKGGYNVEIVVESNDSKFIQDKEVEFIKLYGRKDLGNGELTNLTDGGSANLNHAKQTTLKRMETLKRTGKYSLLIERIKKYAAFHNSGTSYCLKKTYLYSLEGNFVKHFDSKKECAEYLKIGGSNLSNVISKKRSYSGYFISYTKFDKLNTSLYKIVSYKKPVYKINSDFQVTEKYNSGNEAAIAVKANKANLAHSIKKLQKCAGFHWAYTDTVIHTLEKLKNKYTVLALLFVSCSCMAQEPVKIKPIDKYEVEYGTDSLYRSPIRPDSVKIVFDKNGNLIRMEYYNIKKQDEKSPINKN